MKKPQKNKQSAKEEIDYQKLTEQIAREGGLQVDGRGYFDPIYQISMQRDFFKGVKESHNGLSKALIGLVFFIIPASIGLFTMAESFLRDGNLAGMGALVFSVVYFAIGVAIIRGSGQKSSGKKVR